jgi:hypothetical protein
MEEIEGLDKKCLENKDTLSELKKNLQEEKDRIAKEMTLLEEELAEQEKKRSSLLTMVDRDLLKRYILLRERKGGKAVSSVVGGVCQTCHLGIPPQQFNDLQKGEVLQSCPNCNRIIYWGEDKEFQAALGSF